MKQWATEDQEAPPPLEGELFDGDAPAPGEHRYSAEVRELKARLDAEETPRQANRAVARVADTSPPEQAVQVFNPLDARPAQFQRQLQERTENYDALAMHLRGMLIPGKDFGRIHIAGKDKCPRPWECSHAQKPSHWSGYQLFASGADKVLGMLGLGVHYPNQDAYIEASLRGQQIEEVIVACHIFGHDRNVIVEGMGACAKREVQGSLSNAVKRAAKRARLEAVQRLPAISALFEDDFLADIERQAAMKKGGNSTTARTQTATGRRYNTGAELVVMPFGKHQGKRFDEMPDNMLVWIIEHMTDKPDIRNAAKRAWDERVLEAERRTKEPRRPA